MLSHMTLTLETKLEADQIIEVERVRPEFCRKKQDQAASIEIYRDQVKKERNKCKIENL